MENRKILYRIKDVYGRPTIYIADPELEVTFQTIMGQKTISPNKMKAFEDLGFEFVRTY
jgi:hypothetical protein